jgi:hypothetical protein
MLCLNLLIKLSEQRHFKIECRNILNIVSASIFENNLTKFDAILSHICPLYSATFTGTPLYACLIKVGVLAIPY